MSKPGAGKFGRGKGKIGKGKGKFGKGKFGRGKGKAAERGRSGAGKVGYGKKMTQRRAKDGKNTLDNMITKASIRRLARRGGVRRIGGLVYDESRLVVKEFLKEVVRDCVVFAEHAQRK